MLSTLYRLTSQLMTVSAVLFMYMAWQYMSGEMGLHPFISIPVACLAIALPHIFRECK